MHVAQLFGGMTSLKPVVGAYWAERTQGWGIWHTPAPCKGRKERGTHVWFELLGLRVGNRRTLLVT